MRVNVAASTGKSSMHTQHVKFSTYVLGGDGVGGVIAVGVIFEEGEVSGLEEEDDDRWSVLEVVGVVVFFLSSPSLPLVSFSVILLDCIDSNLEGLSLVLVRSNCFNRIVGSEDGFWGTMFHPS